MKRIKAEKISKKFSIGYKKKQSLLWHFLSAFLGKEPKKDIEVLKTVSFEVDSGDILGIIGNNGSGKSTLLRVLAGIYAEDSGKVFSDGKIVSLINLHLGLVDRLTMEENIYLCGALLSLSSKEIKEKLASILEFSGLGEFLNTKLYQFSNGMLQRLVFSIAINAGADILLLDEIFEIGDEDFKKRSSAKIKEVADKGGCVLLVSHDLDLVARRCSRVIWLKDGRIFEEGDAERVIKKYKS